MNKSNAIKKEVLPQVRAGIGCPHERKHRGGLPRMQPLAGMQTQRASANRRRDAAAGCAWSAWILTGGG